MSKENIIFDFKVMYPGSTPTPTLNLIVEDLEGINSSTITAEVDTGFEGALLVPINVYNKLELMKSQLPPDFKNVAITASGEQIELFSAYAKLSIQNLINNLEIEIDAHSTCHHPLIGRELLSVLITIIHGPKQIIEFEMI